MCEVLCSTGGRKVALCQSPVLCVFFRLRPATPRPFSRYSTTLPRLRPPSYCRALESEHVNMALFLLLLPVVLATSPKDCTMTNMQVGDRNITSETELKQYRSHRELKSGKTALLGISAKWCLHCCQFEPIYEQIHKLLKEEMVSGM